VRVEARLGLRGAFPFAAQNRLPWASRIGEFCRKISEKAAIRRRWQKNMKNRDSVLTRFGKSLIVPPAIRLLHISSPKPDQQNIRRPEGDAPHAVVRACKIFSRGFRANRPRKRQVSYAPLGPVASGLFLLRASRVASSIGLTRLARKKMLTWWSARSGFLTVVPRLTGRLPAEGQPRKTSAFGQVCAAQFCGDS
jgi:hypothetical protein